MQQNIEFERCIDFLVNDIFEKVQDSNLMQNKEGGAYRPIFYCTA